MPASVTAGDSSCYFTDALPWVTGFITPPVSLDLLRLVTTSQSRGLLELGAESGKAAGRQWVGHWKRRQGRGATRRLGELRQQCCQSKLPVTPHSWEPAVLPTLAKSSTLLGRPVREAGRQWQGQDLSGPPFQPGSRQGSKHWSDHMEPQPCSSASCHVP